MSVPSSIPKQPFSGDNNPPSQEEQGYKEWLQEAYQRGYERWMPWIEDQYLKWFGKGDNKASYATKDTLSKTKITGIDQVDQVQDDTNQVIGNTLGDKGLLKPAGQFLSKEGINRAERSGKDENGSYGDAGTFLGAGTNGANSLSSGVSQGAEGAQNVATKGLAGIKGLVPGQSEK